MVTLTGSPDSFLLGVLSLLTMLDKLTINLERHEKTAFWPSDFGKPNLDLYFAFTGEPVTNPPKWNETLKWGAGKGVEEQMLKVLKDSDIVPIDYDQKVHGRIDEKVGDITIHGYVDATSKQDNPIEIKSINNKNSFDILKYKRGEPRENYVGQLATYMELKKAKKGALLVASIDGLNYFWFDCKRVRPGVYQCGKVTVDVLAEFARWQKLYNENIIPKIMPDPFQYLYKYDVNTLDWKNQSKNSISDARNGHKVLGDFQVSWSSWKNKIVELQGTHLGYSNEELSVILEKTKGYTSPGWGTN